MFNDVIRRLDSRIDALEEYKKECEELHHKHAEHNRRHDDAMNNLSESNLMLAKSITDINLTISNLTSTVKKDEHVISILRNAGIAWDVNKTVFLGIAAFAAAIMAIVAAYQYFW